MTGRFDPAVALCGAQTLTNRQFSVPPDGNAGKSCTHSLPKAVASRVEVHGVGGCGGSQRREPTGGCAYGMPSHSETPLLTMPQTGPSAVVTLVPDAQAAACDGPLGDALAWTVARTPSDKASAAAAVTTRYQNFLGMALMNTFQRN